MNEPPVSIRRATRADAAPAADLIHLSMGSEADWLFGQEKNHPTDSVMQALFIRNGNRISHEVCWLAEREDRLVGLLLAYPGRRLRALDLRTGMHLVTVFGLPATIRLARRQPLYGDLVEAQPDEFYVSNLAVVPEQQGRGIGGNLLAFTDELAAGVGLKKCSLIVSFDNPARRLYERCGYKIVREYEIAHPMIAHGSGGYHRMVKDFENPQPGG